MSNAETAEAFTPKRVFAWSITCQNECFCIAGMDGSVWVDDKGLADTLAYLEQQSPNDASAAAYSFQVRLLSIALESGKLRRVSREEADAIAVDWAARIVAEQNGANDA